MTKKTTANGAIFFAVAIIVLFTLLTAIGFIKRKKLRTLAESETVTSFSPAPKDAIESKTREQITENYGKIPMSFEANEGQTDAEVRFLSRGRGYSLFLTATESVLVLQKSVPQKPRQHNSSHRLNNFRRPAERDSCERIDVRMRLLGGNPGASVEGLEELPGKTTYLTGSDPTKWRTNVRTYAKVRYRSVYPSIDMVYYGNQGTL